MDTNIRPPQDGMSGKERYDARRREKQASRAQESFRVRRPRQVRKVIGYLLLVVALGLIGYGLLGAFETRRPEGPDFSQSVPVLGAGHIPEGSGAPEFNSDPPTSGSHYPLTARTGFREEEISDMYLVHNLEHGDIWISYRPSMSEDIQKELEQFAGPKVVITPRSANENDIALAAWGRLDAFDLTGETLLESEAQRIRDFIVRYVNKGPERVAGGTPGGV